VFGAIPYRFIPSLYRNKEHIDMRISPLATAMFAASAIYALSAAAQTASTPSTQPTQGVPQSMTHQGNGSTGTVHAHKQKTQGVPLGSTNPQYGSASKQKTSGVPASMLGDGQYGGAVKQQ
jgi:hypothetical protein